MIKKFEEWWDAGYSNQVDMDCARQSWDYQQQRIDLLEKQFKVILDIALRRGKILEQQFGYFDE